MAVPKLGEHGLGLMPGLPATHHVEAIVLLKSHPDPARHVYHRPCSLHDSPLSQDSHPGIHCMNLNRKCVAFLVDQRVQASAEVSLRSVSGGQVVQLLVIYTLRASAWSLKLQARIPS